MPIYEFACASCDHQFEELAAWGDKPRCPTCGAKDARRLLSGFSVRGDGASANRTAMRNVPFQQASCCGGSCSHTKRK